MSNTFAVLPTLTVKKGSGGGVYTTSSTSYVDVDATNLAYTVTIPTGWKLDVSVYGTCYQSTGTASIYFALIDGSTIAPEVLVSAPAITTNENFALGTQITGDGASHTIKLQYKTSAGADAANVQNASATFTPVMKFILLPSN